MKKILLSCVCCVLALGLVTACDNEEEEPNEPEVPGTVVDDGGSELATIKSGKLGLLYEENYHYLYFTGEVTDGFKGTLSEDWSDGVSVTLAGTADSCYLSFEQNGSTVYVGGYTEGNYFDMDVESTPYELKYDSTNDAILTTDGKYYLGAYNGEYLRWMSSTYLGNEGDYTAHIYSSAQTNPTAPTLPDPVEWAGEGTYLFGFNTGSAVQYIDGTTPSGYTYRGNLTTNLTYAVPVTIGEYTASSDDEPDDDNDGNDSDGSEAEDELPAYTLSFELEGVTYYITITVSTSGNKTYYNLAYSTEEAPIYWDDTNGYWVDETGKYFLCYNSSYKCLYCSAIADYGTSPAAATYEYNELPAPTSLEIVGASVVYVGYTTQLSVEVEEGASASVIWSVPEGTSALTISEYGLVSGVSASSGDITITATSTVDETNSATHTIKVVELETPNVGTDTAYKLGCLDSENFTYRWFDGTTGYYLNTTTEWDSAADVYVTELASDGIEGSCTLSIYDDQNSKLQYIASSENSSNKSNMKLSDNPYVWVWDEENQLFYTPSFEDRFISLHNGNEYFGANALSNASDSEYYHVIPYTTKPTDPVRPDPTSLTISGDSYVEVSKELTLTVSAEPYGALADVTWSVTGPTGDDSNGTASITNEGVFTASATGEYTVTATSTIVETVTASKVIIVVNEGAITTESITYETIMSLSQFSGTTWGNSQTSFSSVEGVATDFTGCSITWYTGASGSTNGCSIYNSLSLRMYYGASFALSATEGYAIDGVVLNFTGSVNNFEVTNATYTNVTGTYTLSGPIDSESPITVANAATSSNTFTFADAGIVVTIVNLNYSVDA